MHAMNRRMSLCALALCTLAMTHARAEVEGPQITFSPHAGTVLWYSGADLEENILLGGRLGLAPTAWFGVEGVVDYTPTSFSSDPSQKNRVTHLGAHAVLNLAPYHAVSPYLAGGWSQLFFDGAGTGESRYNGWEFGAGFKFRMVHGNGKQINLRLDATNVMTQFDGSTFLGADASKPQHNMMLTAGIEFGLGTSQTDRDKDGIPDRRDYCTATPQRAMVDANGCATDADLDGVADGLDICNDTPGGAVVDSYGCAGDSDSDGVMDGIDRCDATPTGATVDNMGCPKDSDSDGIADGLDRCPDTAEGISVDNFGCAMDTDGDGVKDGIDVCAATPQGVKVDPQGCPVVTSQKERELLDTGLLRLDRVFFQSGRAELRSESFAALNEVGQILVKWPQLRIEIGGHTDSQGAEDMNQRLSESRARSVFEYLARTFPNIDSGQYSIVGYGESRSIATNDTAEGRSRNRRVEFQILNREVLSR